MERPETASDAALGEARQHFRSPRKLRWAVDYEPVVTAQRPQADTGRRSAQTLGISLGGTFIVSDHAPAVETPLHLWLHPCNPVPGGPAVIRLRAEVRWINAEPGPLPRGFGVAFRAITAADEVALHSGFSRSDKVV